MIIRLAGLGFALAMLGSGCKNIEAGQADPGTVGAECTADGECVEVEAPTCLKMPGGYCSTTCGGGVFDCDDQSVCDELGDQAYYCLDGCLTDNGNTDCRDDYRCSLREDVVNFDGSSVGVCVPVCKTDGDCEAGRRCDTGSGDCIPKGEKTTGDSCSANAQCNNGLCIKAAEFRGGYCSGRCGSQFADCEQGSHCAPLGGDSVCLAGCEADGDCRDGEGYKCRQIATKKDQEGNDRAIKVCSPKCQNNDECADGEHCDAASGDCVEGVGDPNPLGAFCSADGDCVTGTCQTGDAWPNGYCTGACDACDGVCGPTRDGDLCLAACEADLDCRPGYTCTDGGCNARCQNNDDCVGEQICNASTGRCGEASSGDSQVQQLTIENGVSVRGELSEELSLEVPEGTLGFAVLAEGSGSDLMVIGEMRNPNGTTIYDFQDPFGSSVRFFPGSDQITQFVPSSPRSAPIPGTYKFRLIKDGGQANIDVSAIIKTSDGEPQGATLDVNFFFARVDGLDAASAQNSAEFQASVTELKRIYAGRGIQVNRVDYCDIAGNDSDRYSVIDSVDGPGSELSKMFALSGRAADYGCNPDRALNFFLVQEIVGGRAGYIILGIAGGIPGPPTINGTTHSGVAVTMVNYKRNPTQLAQTMAHEGGHFLGLFHTTEAEGTAFDPLSDTPECTNSNDRNSDGIVDYGECGSGKGNENLMFWAAGDAAEVISGDQGFVLLRNPALQ